MKNIYISSKFVNMVCARKSITFLAKRGILVPRNQISLFVELCSNLKIKKLDGHLDLLSNLKKNNLIKHFFFFIGF
jgi:hypothetical protein